MAAKIQIKNDRINSFGGIFFIIDQFRSSGLAALADNTLGAKGINMRYSYSNVIENLTSVFVSGGEALEDVNFFRQEAFKANPDYRFCSADTIGRDLRGLEAPAEGRRRYLRILGILLLHVAADLGAKPVKHQGRERRCKDISYLF